MPTLETASETTANNADGIKTTFEMLQEASQYSSKELYQKEDVHMTDSTAHNIGISKNIADILNIETTAGQLFCTSYTALGFDRAIEKVLNENEN